MPAAMEEEPCFGSWITDCSIHQHKNKQLQTTVLGTWPNSVEGSEKGRLKLPRLAKVIFRNKKRPNIDKRAGRQMRSLLLDRDGGP